MEGSKRTGRQVTVRLVKGAYWDFETIHAEEQGWPCPVWNTKPETDACFERMTEIFLGSTPRSENEGGVKLALGSHNARSIAAALDLVPNLASASARLPLSGQDDERYALMNSLLRVLGAMEFTGAIVLVDRMDEPPLISGDPQRMRPVGWPLLNNKFLQMPRIGVKALLPLELRHELCRESSAFFQEARLD